MPIYTVEKFSQAMEYSQKFEQNSEARRPAIIFWSFFQDSIPMWVSIRNPMRVWKLLQEGNGGETPDTMKIGLDQAGRFKPSSSDRIVHYSFLLFYVKLERDL